MLIVVVYCFFVCVFVCVFFFLWLKIVCGLFLKTQQTHETQKHIHKSNTQNCVSFLRYGLCLLLLLVVCLCVFVFVWFSLCFYVCLRLFFREFNKHTKHKQKHIQTSSTQAYVFFLALCVVFIDVFFLYY